MRPLLIQLLLTISACSVTRGNTDLILQDIRAIHLNRPISVIVTDKMPEKCEKSYACAANAYEQGRCIVFIRPDKLEFIYHELGHCAGITHTPDGD